MEPWRLSSQQEIELESESFSMARHLAAPGGWLNCSAIKGYRLTQSRPLAAMHSQYVIMVSSCPKV